MGEQRGEWLLITSTSCATFSQHLTEAKRLKAWTCRAFGYTLLKGVLKGRYAVSVSGNWRVTFRFEGGHAVDVDYVDYH